MKDRKLAQYEGTRDLATIKQCADYDPLTGKFTWKVRASYRVTIGDECGTICKGYRVIQFGKLYTASRLAWWWITGETPSAFIDHINRNRLDNRFCNLRLANFQQNAANSPGYCKREFKGIYRSGATRWRAKIREDGKNKHLGYFATKEEAALAYDKAAAKAFGEFAFLNFPNPSAPMNGAWVDNTRRLESE